MAWYVRTSTGFVTIIKTALGLALNILGMTSLIMAEFFLTKSRRVSPGF